MPGLFLYRSNLVEMLSSLLAVNLQAEPLQDPFAREYIVVGSRGTEEWLRRRLSEEMGVCANVTFPFPMAHLGAALKSLTEDNGSRHTLEPWSPDALMWAILECLPTLLHRAEFQSLRNYLGADAFDASEESPLCIGRKLVSLARQIADVFDRYIAYRPEWAVAWSKGKRAPNLKIDETDPCAWQPILWQSVVKLLGPNESHIATQIEGFTPGNIVDPVGRLGYARLSIFAVSTLPPSYLNILTGLSQVIDVHLYVLCPSDQYWGDIGKAHSMADQAVLSQSETWSQHLRQARESQDTHPLLVSLGRVARDFQTMLLNLPDQFDDQTFVSESNLYLDPLSVEASRAEQRGHEAGYTRVMPSALATIQSDIFCLKSPQSRSPGRTLDSTDDSIQVHACHGPTRQVEVLRDTLLHLLERHAHVQPRDILVMTPDIERYAPLISAIFDEGRDKPLPSDGYGPDGGPRLPYRIADLSVRRLNPVADTLMRVLEMANGRVEASTMLDFLALEPPQLRFGVEPTSLPQLQTWLEQAGICWGVDAEHRQQEHAQPFDMHNTWQFGLERLALGVTMADDGQLFQVPTDPNQASSENRGVIPFDAMEGENTKLLGKFMECCSSVFSQIGNLKKPRAIRDWAESLRDATSALCATTAESAFLLKRVLRVIEQMQQAAGLVDCQLPIELPAIISYLNGRFEIAQESTHNADGAITFCAMLPMRGLPYKVVALLGMDDGTFPRNPTTPGFDLSAHPRRIGDRDPRNDDRLLLLEALQSAREHLLIYYSGRNVRTNEKQEPAGPIAELLDTLDQSFEFPRGQLGTRRELVTTHHPLQAFHPGNFSSKPRRQTKPAEDQFQSSAPWSFDSRKLEAARCVGSPKQEPRAFLDENFTIGAEPSERGMVVQLSDLIRFVSQPIVHFFNESIGLVYAENRNLVADREPIAMDGLAQWKLANTLLPLALDETGIDQPRALMLTRAGGELPLGTPGRLMVRERVEVVESGAHLFKTVTSDRPPLEPLGVDLTLQNGVRIIGQVPGRWGDTALVVDTGKENPKRLIAPWIRHLVWTAQQPEDCSSSSLLLCARNKDGTIYQEHVRLQLEGSPTERQHKAREELAEFTKWYVTGAREPLRLLQKTSYAFAQIAREHLVASQFATGAPDILTQEQHVVLAKASREASKTWEGSQNIHGEAAERHLARAFPNEHPHLQVADDGTRTVHPKFAYYALRLWGPLLSARHEER